MAQYINIPSGNFFNANFTRPELPGGKGGKNKEKFILRRIFDQWVDRLLGAVSEGSLADAQPEHASHRTSQDFLWNTVGYTAWGMVFPLLTVIVTQLSGVEQAGMFSLVFVTATLLMILANFGVRTFQISDVEEKHSFSEYQIHRVLTCLLMLLVGYVYCCIRGYAEEMFLMSIAVYAYRMVDGLADVYEGRLQQQDKLYLAGISLATRSIVSLIVFTFVLLITRSLVIASFAMAIVAFIVFLFVSAPLALLETPRSRKATLSGILSLFKQCAPLFIALFMYTLIDNMPKFVMEGALSYDNQLYFNALYFPATVILMVVGFVYKPLLVRMANAWADVNRRKLFDIFIVGIVAVIVAVTAVAIFVMNWIGIPVMTFMYGVDFEPYRQLSIVMLLAGGVTGVIDFLYQVVTVLRKQHVVMKLYLITFFFSLFVPFMMITIVGLPGAALGYMIVMSILAVLLVMEYVKVRIEYIRNPQAEFDDDLDGDGQGFGEGEALISFTQRIWGNKKGGTSKRRPQSYNSDARQRAKETRILRKAMAEEDERVAEMRAAREARKARHAQQMHDAQDQAAYDSQPVRQSQQPTRAQQLRQSQDGEEPIASQHRDGYGRHGR